MSNTGSRCPQRNFTSPRLDTHSPHQKIQHKMGDVNVAASGTKIVFPAIAAGEMLQLWDRECGTHRGEENPYKNFVPAIPVFLIRP